MNELDQPGPVELYEILSDLAAFAALARPQHRSWPAQVRRGIKRLAVTGLRDPLDDARVPPERLEVENENLRETIGVDGVVSRHRAQLLVLRRLIETGELPPLKDMRVYLSESVTHYASYLRDRCPKLRSSEYLPDPNHHLRGQVANRDLRNLSLPPASMHCLLCNEVLEHVEELEPTLEAMAQALTLGGYLLATVPMAYGQRDSIVKALWKGEGEEPELLMEAEWHGDPLDSTKGSLVYRIPGWELLDQLRGAGFREATIHAVSSMRYGVIGAELPFVFIVVAKR